MTLKSERSDEYCNGWRYEYARHELESDEKNERYENVKPMKKMDDKETENPKKC